MFRSLRRLSLAAVCSLALLTGLEGGLPSASAADSVVLAGHGYGHGRGLSQWGALGYAVDHGWNWAQILDHYYGGTATGTAGNPEMTVRLTALDGASSVTVTSSRDFWVGDAAGAYRISGGDAATLTRAGAGWTLTARRGGCSGAVAGGAVPLPAVPEAAPAADPGADARAPLTTCQNGRGYRGKLRFVVDAGATRVVDVLDTESYLRGVVPRESPAGWADQGGGRGIEALRAQAVAARSYALSESRASYAKTCDTTSCQVYGGAALNGAWVEDGRTDRAIADTAGVVRRNGSGAVVRTEFSSSSGGWTAGGQFTAVADLGDTRSPYHDWQVTVTAAQVQAAWPAIGSFVDLRVTGRNGLGADGGRVTSVQVVGTAGTVTASGNDVRSRLGLRSDWFSPVGTSVLWSELREAASGGAPDHQVRTGSSTGTALGCDVSGSGRDRLAVYDAGIWTLRASLSDGPADKTFAFGAAGWLPVCGDWNGDGIDGIGVWDPSTGRWYLRDSAGPGAPDLVVQYGWSGALPVVGDWDGNGTDTIGVWDKQQGTWLLRRTNAAGAADVQVQFGFSGAVPVPADWNGDGLTDIGVVAGGTWCLRDSLTPGAARTFSYGAPTDRPVTGDWDGTGGSGIGVSRPGRL
ncbi:SpoIID/LytB domain-containing protein [Geodermatophilus nigrescens]